MLLLEVPFILSVASLWTVPARAAFFDTETKLVASDTATGDEFGYSVAISGNTALVGAIGDDDGGTDSGSAYLYTGIPEPSSFLLATLASLFGLVTRRCKEVSPRARRPVKANFDNASR